MSSINGLLTPDHIEKLLLLFKVFDGLSLSTSQAQQDVFRYIAGELNEAKIQELSDKHGIDAIGEEPWKKVLIGSSDDHAGLYIGGGCTEVEAAATPAEFLAQVQAGKVKAHGTAGDVSRFSAGLYKIIFSYASDRLSKTAPNAAKLMGRVADRFLSGENPAQLSFSERVGHVLEAVRSGKALDFLKPNDLSLNREIALYFIDSKVKKEIDEVIRTESTPERRSFRVASKIANDLAYRLFQRGLEQVNQHNYLEALQPASGMLPVAGSVAPYVFSYFNLYGDRPMWKETAARFGAEVPDVLRNDKRAWFTDTLEDVNGVARTIRTMGKAAEKAGRDLTIVTSRAGKIVEDAPIKNFHPVGEFELPEYKLQKLSFPPILDMIDYIERERITECIISTPGPVGLSALAGAKLMGIRTTGIYHTDFPQYVRILTEDEVMETMMWNFMHWFYSQLDLIYVNSEFYKDCWIKRGIPAEKLKILPRGLDTDQFNHLRKSDDFWKKRGAKHPVMIYVGRVSKEKELEFLCEVCEALKAKGIELDLAVVGDGPYKEEMQQRLPEALFAGVLMGDELAEAYAAADLFVFPSTTDTFGNVVIEAMSSGIPAYVSDIGGPCELVTEGHDGRILKANHLITWVDAIAEWVADPESDQKREKIALDTQARWNWSHAFDKFWQDGL
ncbi:MAG: glycosyltransferase family 1 protein [Verrucomicrobiota bacterium]